MQPKRVSILCVVAALAVTSLFAVAQEQQKSEASEVAAKGDSSSRSGRAAKSHDRAVPAAHTAALSQDMSSTYIIGAGDSLAINVWHENEISQKLSVRPDGMISLPLLGDVPASGLTPDQLGANIQQRLTQFLTNPHVTVIVSEVKSKFFTVMGEVAKPGTYALNKQTTILEALSEAGGLKEFAKKQKIYVLRKDENGRVARLPFNYAKVVKGAAPEQNIGVSYGDTIVVP